MPTVIGDPLVAPSPVLSPALDPGVWTGTQSDSSLDSGYVVIVWNDPVNLMNYVTWVFQQVFRWPKEKAEKHMLEVHKNGSSVVAQETSEKAEAYVHQLQSFKLQATMEKVE